MPSAAEEAAALEKLDRQVGASPQAYAAAHQPSPALPSSPHRLLSARSFPASSPGADYNPPSSASSAYSLIKSTAEEALKEAVILKYMNSPGSCVVLLRKHPVRVEGWCRLSLRVPNKPGGYVQISADKVNHFALLQEVTLWAVSAFVGVGEQCSHLCCQPLCCTLGHVIAESELVNQRRKGCLVWVDCPHCNLKILVCPHLPPCVKYAPGWADQGQFLANGIH